MMRGDVLLEIGDGLGASSFESVADPTLPIPTYLSRGVALFELGRSLKRKNAAHCAVMAPVEAHHTLGLIAELQGTGAESEHFAKPASSTPSRRRARSL
jgi:hypothetical protein